MNKNNRQPGEFKNKLSEHPKTGKETSLSKKGNNFKSNSKNQQPTVSSTYFETLKKSDFFDKECLKNSNKVWTTDESNPCHSSNEHNSINMIPFSSKKNIYTQPFSPYQESRNQSKSVNRLKALSKKKRKSILGLVDSKLDKL